MSTVSAGGGHGLILLGKSEAGGGGGNSPNLFINEEYIAKIRIEWEGRISQAEIIAGWATSNFSYIFGNL